MEERRAKYIILVGDPGLKIVLGSSRHVRDDNIKIVIIGKTALFF
jgi:hypothetical protein